MTKVLSVWLAFFYCFSCFAEVDPQITRPYIVVLYGAPGSGRATMAVRLRRDFAFPTISLATILANHVLEEPSPGSGEREYFNNGSDFPTELLPKILCQRLLQSDCHSGAFLEEVSLTTEQVRDIQKQLSPHFQFLVINIEASDEWLVQRVERRLVCYNCGYVYGDSESNRKSKTCCDICSSPLQRRQGDTPEVIKTRLGSYRSQLSPLLDLYREQGVLIQVPGDRNFDEIYKDILKIIEDKTSLVASKNHLNPDLRAQE